MILNSVRLPHFNDAAGRAAVEAVLPRTAAICLSQGGTPCTPLVRPGDEVFVGGIIGDSDAYVSAPVHSSLSGKVAAIREITTVQGKKADAVIIEAGERQIMSPGIKPPEVNNREGFLKAVRASGAVGLGGAGFPVHVKLGFNPEKTKADILAVNGAECEPYITTDYRGFIEHADAILDGVSLILKYLEIPRAVIGIENDKPEAVSIIREEISKRELENISVKPLGTRYPQGAEKILVHSLTGRVVKEGNFPISEGCVVINSSTAAFLADYFKSGVPLISRRITIDGDAVKTPANITVPLGMAIRDIIAQTELVCEPGEIGRIIAGGPMMGNCIYDLDFPVMKTTNALLIFKNSGIYKTTACIRCGNCVRVCSMNLSPTEIERAFDWDNMKLLAELNVKTCMECGACTFICPAKRNLTEKIRLAKAKLTEARI